MGWGKHKRSGQPGLEGSGVPYAKGVEGKGKKGKDGKKR